MTTTKMVLEEKKKYEAQIDDYGVKTAKNGSPFIQVYFHIPGYGSVQWNGYMTAKTMEKTFKTLATLGFSSGDLAPLESGPISKALDMQTKFSITVRPQTNTDGSVRKSKKGETYFEVQFVNAPKKEKFERTETSALSQYANDWNAFKAANGIKTETPKLDF